MRSLNYSSEDYVPNQFIRADTHVQSVDHVIAYRRLQLWREVILSPPHSLLRCTFTGVIDTPQLCNGNFHNGWAPERSIRNHILIDMCFHGSHVPPADHPYVTIAKNDVVRYKTDHPDLLPLAILALESTIKDYPRLPGVPADSISHPRILAILFHLLNKDKFKEAMQHKW